jgi:hypothetical protein
MTRTAKKTEEQEKGDAMDVSTIHYCASKHPDLLRKVNSHAAAYRKNVSHADTPARHVIQTFLEVELPRATRLLEGRPTSADIAYLADLLAKAQVGENKVAG